MERTTDVLVLGAGQAGLAMSRCLARLEIGHVILERGRIAERWRSERWDSLRMLTPNWMSRLPGGWTYSGLDPDGFMTAPQVAAHLEVYAHSFGAPVVTGRAVRALRAVAGGFLAETTRGEAWHARAVVIATGHCDRPIVPAMARDLPGGIRQVTPPAYRRPGLLPRGGVLVVGASATGVQVAEEIHRSGRPVHLAVGRHMRLPRRYRGRDIMAWLERIGVLEDRAEAMRDLARARAQPSLQLVGRTDRPDLDLGTLQAMGVRLHGRATGMAGGAVRFADDLAATNADAQRRLEKLLARIDAAADAEGAPAGSWPAALDLGPAPPRLHLAAAGIRTVFWATGYGRDYGWLRVPVLDTGGEILHQGGVTPVPGLYVLGLHFLRLRRSSLLDGVGADAEVLAAHIHRHLTAGGGRAAA